MKYIIWTLFFQALSVARTQTNQTILEEYKNYNDSTFKNYLYSTNVSKEYKPTLGLRNTSKESGAIIFNDKMNLRTHESSLTTNKSHAANEINTTYENWAKSNFNGTPYLPPTENIRVTYSTSAVIGKEIKETTEKKKTATEIPTQESEKNITEAQKLNRSPEIDLDDKIGTPVLITLQGPPG